MKTPQHFTLYKMSFFFKDHKRSTAARQWVPDHKFEQVEERVLWRKFSMEEKQEEEEKNREERRDK
jgi:hypothetical protein